MLVLNGQVFYDRRFQALDLRIVEGKVAEVRPRGAFDSELASRRTVAGQQAFPQLASPADTQKAAEPADKHKAMSPGNSQEGANPADFPEEVIDAEGLLVLPGLTDIHTHGAVEADFSDGDLEAMRRVQAYEASVGVTQFCPTSMTLGLDHLAQVFAGVKELQEGQPQGAEVLGLHMEGPYISPQKLGAQNPAYVIPGKYEDFARLQELSGNNIRVLSLAPEMPGALDFIQQTASETLLSLAHTQASYEEARAAFEAGAHHLTHMFNAMPGLHHREPGPIAAARDCPQVTVELIADGVHVHPAMVRLAFALFPGRVCLVSDSMRATGLADGEYDLGGQAVRVQGREARLANGSLAGSVTNLADCLRAVYRMGVPLEEALYAATSCPAQAIGLGDLYGSLQPGSYANFILADAGLNFQAVYVRGLQQ